MILSHSPPAPMGRKKLGVKFGIGVFALLGIASMWAAGMVYFRYAVDRQIEYTYRTNDNLAAAFAAHTEQTLKEIEGMLRVAALEYRRAGRRVDLPRFFSDSGLKSEMLVAVVILDAKGDVLAASEPNYPRRSQAEREHFLVHVNEDTRQLYSAKPVIGRFSNVQILTFSLRLSGPRGEFEGVIVTGVRPQYFINLYQQVNLGSNGAVSFFGLDGFIRARITAGEIGVGQDVRKAEMIARARANESGRLLFTAVTDKVTRLYSYRRVAGYPLAIAVGQADDEALLEVQRIVRTARVVGLLLTVLVLVGVILLWRGLSRDQKMQRALQERSEELQTANERLSQSLEVLGLAKNHLVQTEKMAALGGLVAGVAHEINTPLGVGVTAASHLELKVQDLAQRFSSGALSRDDMAAFITNATTSAEMVLSNLKRAADLIRSFKQIAVDQSSDQLRYFYLWSYLEEVLLSLSPQLRSTRHQVSVSCPQELRIYSHPGSCSQIITNLVMNSLLHGFEGMEIGHIVIQIEEQAEDILLRYSDDGRGIAPEHLAHIFEPFYTTKRGQGGSGLGLHIVYNIVTQGLKGSIECRSTAGQGVVFEIRIPRATFDGADDAPAAPSHPGGG